MTPLERHEETLQVRILVHVFNVTSLGLDSSRAEKSLLFLPGFVPRLLDYPASSLLTTLFRLCLWRREFVILYSCSLAVRYGAFVHSVPQEAADCV